MLTVTRPRTTNRTWSCDCTARGQEFQTVDEKVAVQHMQGHFRRKENYRMVITHFGDEGVVVEDVRGATFDELGQPKTVTLEDLKQAVTPEPERERAYHYSTLAEIRIMVHDALRPTLNGFDATALVADKLRELGAPLVRTIQTRGYLDNQKRQVSRYRIMADDAKAARRAERAGTGHTRGKAKRVRELAKALSGLPDDKLDALLRALS